MKSTSSLLLPIFCLFLSFPTIFGQSLRSYERAGDDAVKKKDYGAAVQHYATVLKRDQDNISVLWKYAESARLYFAYAEADKSYQKIAVSKRPNKDFPLLNFRLGEVKKSQGKYDAAIDYFEKFLKERPIKAGPEFFEKALDEIEVCRAAKVMMAESQQVEVKNLGRGINSPYSDFAPVVMGDTLFFSSYRFDKKGDRSQPKSKLTRVMISSKGGRAREPGRGFPTTDTAHIAHTAFSPDGHYMVFSVCKNLNAYDIRCELWLTVVDRRNRWLPAIRLPEPINLPGYTATQPNIGYDEYYQGPVLWFASDRPGGKGNLDLWYVPLDTVFFCPCALPLPGKTITRLPRFQEPLNASALNTPENDGMPFFFAPTQQLYFSSEGWPGLGGWDVFSVQKEKTDFSKPTNAGPGVNTSYNDVYFFLKEDGQHGYLSSNRPGSLYLDEANKACCNDLWSFKLPKPVTPPNLAATDSVPTISAKSPPVETETLPQLPQAPQLQDFVGLPLYFDNDEPDKRTRRTTTQKTYEETVQSYLERQREYRDRFSAGLPPMRADDAESMIDAFFENEVRRGHDRLGQLCDVLLARLQKGESIEVMVKGYTSPRARTEYNLNLGKRRVSSVKNHFAAFSDGAFAPYLRSGQLKITEVSFGETTARSDISDDLADERNSIYHPDASRERRVEIVEIRER
ncbi:MAG: PD40 domain-containing protein [Saprospiraceae bacterium]|nr:PD40 domain-containing protein [Saprospiraceae bacterium]